MKWPCNLAKFLWQTTRQDRQLREQALADRLREAETAHAEVRNELEDVERLVELVDDAVTKVDDLVQVRRGFLSDAEIAFSPRRKS